MLANINISNSDNNFQYVVEYEKSDRFSTAQYYEIDEDIYLSHTDMGWKRNGNIWEVSTNKGQLLNDQEVRISRINVFLPKFSVDTYSKGTHYSLDLSTWVHGKKIILGTYIFNRLDTYAPFCVRKFSNEEYYEEISFDIVDPYDLIYSDYWAKFREDVCGEKYVDGSTINNTGAILHCSLYPVEKNEGEYVKMDGYDGGQNSINISDNDHDFLRVKLTTNINSSLLDQEPSFKSEILFNWVYEGNLEEYFLETYNMIPNDIRFELVVGAEDDIYAVLQKYSTTQSCIFVKSELEEFFTNRIGWKEGIYVVASVSILDDDEEIMHILSNKIPLNEDLLGYFIKDNLNIHYVDLTELNMNSYNLTIPNKIQKNIVQFSGHSNTKNNIIQPQFFRVSQLSNMVIHPEVTETICINLDQYKSLVDGFMIKIEGCIFPEVGRTSSGVMFKIKGNILPRQKTEGIYYVLSKDSSLITTGKYTYEG